jgi:hypothetical protein
MDLIDKLHALASKAERITNTLETEEATKNALIMPFLQSLGYDVFNPEEVVPEFTADVGTKRGEKVDYAIFLGGQPSILIECKKLGSVLTPENSSQLFRYYAATSARFGVLTDGVTYKFYADLVERNKMDSIPFFEFSLRNFDESSVAEIKKFAKETFNLESVLNTAEELKYTKESKKILANLLSDPPADFIRFVGSKYYDGKMTQNVVDRLTPIMKRAFSQFISERVQERLKSALEKEDPKVDADLRDTGGPEMIEDDQENGGRDVETTVEELEGFYIVKAILRGHVAPSRIVHRDTLSYFGILLDDNNRKPICRLHFNNSEKKVISLFDANKKETRYNIAKLDDIYALSEKIIAGVQHYDDKPTED